MDRSPRSPPTAEDRGLRAPSGSRGSSQSNTSATPRQTVAAVGRDDAAVRARRAPGGVAWRDGSLIPDFRAVSWPGGSCPFGAESVTDQFGDSSQLSHAPRTVSRSYNPPLGIPESSALLCCLVTIETSPILRAALGVIITIRAVEPGQSSIEATSSYRSHKDLPFPLAGIMPIPVSAAVRYICRGFPE